MKEDAKREQAIDDLYDRTIEAMEKCSGPITNLNCISHKITGEDEEY